MGTFAQSGGRNIIGKCLNCLKSYNQNQSRKEVTRVKKPSASKKDEDKKMIHPDIREKGGKK
jgi:hypothetical protein